MVALLDKYLFKFISKKLYSLHLLVAVTMVCAHFGYDLPAEFFYSYCSYTLGQSGVDIYKQVKG